MYKYLPRADFMVNLNPKEFISTLQWEMHLASRRGNILEFNLVHDYSIVEQGENNDGSTRFNLIEMFRGDISIPESLRVQQEAQQEYTFLFSTCIRDKPPIWLYNSLHSLYNHNDDFERRIWEDQMAQYESEPEPWENNDQIIDRKSVV